MATAENTQASENQQDNNPRKRKVMLLALAVIVIFAGLVSGPGMSCTVAGAKILTMPM